MSPGIPRRRGQEEQQREDQTPSCERKGKAKPSTIKPALYPHLNDGDRSCRRKAVGPSSPVSRETMQAAPSKHGVVPGTMNFLYLSQACFGHACAMAAARRWVGELRREVGRIQESMMLLAVLTCREPQASIQKPEARIHRCVSPPGWAVWFLPRCGAARRPKA